MRVRFRFSLRALLAFTVIVAGCCYWATVPSVYARRFVAAVAAGDYASADALFISFDDRFLEKWNDKYPTFKVHAQVAPLSAWQMLRGERHVLVSIMYGNPVLVKGRDGHIVATRTGLDSPQLQPSRFGQQWNDPVLYRLPLSAL